MRKPAPRPVSGRSGVPWLAPGPTLSVGALDSVPIQAGSIADRPDRGRSSGEGAGLERCSTICNRAVRRDRAGRCNRVLRVDRPKACEHGSHVARSLSRILRPDRSSPPVSPRPCPFVTWDSAVTRRFAVTLCLAVAWRSASPRDPAATSGSAAPRRLLLRSRLPALPGGIWLSIRSPPVGTGRKSELLARYAEAPVSRYKDHRSPSGHRGRM